LIGDVGVVFLELFNLILLLLFLHLLLVFYFFLFLFLLPSLFVLFSLFSFFSFFCDSFFSILILFISFIFFILADLQLGLHICHPRNVLQQVLLFGIGDEGSVVSISQLFLLLVDLISLVSQLLSFRVDVVKLGVESGLRLCLSRLALLQLVNLGLKGFDLRFNFRQINSSFFLGAVHGLKLGVSSVSLLNAWNGFFEECDSPQVLLLFLVVS